MSVYHCSIKIGSRAKGQSAIAASAYRAGDKLTEEETGLTSDYTRKSGIVYSEISLCSNAPAEYADRETLWNSVHEIEKASNSRLWREFEVALPQELSRAEQIDTIREFVKGLTEQGMCADWSLHDKSDGNPHAHIMATMRSITEDGKWAAKSRKVYDLDENGERIFQKVDKTGRKQYKSHKEDYNDWNAKERVEEWRSAWAECCNARLAERDRIDHRSHQRRGLEIEPTIHEGYVARAIEKNGGISDRCQLNREIQERNRQIRAIHRMLQVLKEELEELEKEKKKASEKINAGKQRIADLFARRSRTVDSNVRGLTAGKREFEDEVAPSRADEQSDTETIFRVADSIIQDTDTAISQSETTITSTTAHRAERDAERERLRTEALQRAEEERKRRAEECYAAETRKSKNRGYSR